MTGIEWTEETWNPVTGCDRCSPGCDNCYALTMAGRLKAMGQPKYQNDGDPATSGPGFGVTCHPDELERPQRWRKPRTVFVNSMSDLFHPDVPTEFLRDVWMTMHDAVRRGHTFQILTKRPQRMAAALGPNGIGWYAVEGPVPRPEPGIWLGTSIETDRYAFRADHLRQTPAAVRFLSLEPLLGPLPSLDLTGIDWVIVGGESGRNARPMHPDWVRDIRDRCVAAGIPLFFKQWGHWAPTAPVHPDFDDQDQVDAWDALDPEGPLVALELGGAIPQTINPDRCDHQPAPGAWWMAPVGKKLAGRSLDGIIWSQSPEVAA
ncbi:MAG: phage Gp37/Gp68 family protein [Actinomycetota bacterium]